MNCEPLPRPRQRPARSGRGPFGAGALAYPRASGISVETEIKSCAAVTALPLPTAGDTTSRAVWCAEAFPPGFHPAMAAAMRNTLNAHAKAYPIFGEDKS